MQLSKQDVINLKDAITVAKVLNIDNIVINDGMVLAFNEAKSAAIVSPIALDVPEGVKMGLVRVKELESRISVFQGDFVVDLTLTPNNDVKSIKMSTEAMTVSYRCASIRDIQAPKGINPGEYVSFNLSQEDVKMIAKGAKMMKADTVDFSIGKNGISVIATDVNNEQFKYDLSCAPEFTDEPEMDVISLHTDMVCNLFAALGRSDTDIRVTITENKIFGFDYFNHKVYLIPTNT